MFKPFHSLLLSFELVQHEMICLGIFLHKDYGESWRCINVSDFLVSMSG